MTPEHITFVLVLRCFQVRKTFSCLYPKWKENDTYCSSALRPNHCESVMTGGWDSGACLALCSFDSPPLWPFFKAPLVTCTVLTSLCWFSPESLALAISLSIASFTNSIFALHSQPLLPWTAPISHFLFCKVLVSSLSSFQPSFDSQLPTVDPRGCLGLISKATRRSHSLCVCHHYPGWRLLWGGVWRRSCWQWMDFTLWAELNCYSQNLEGSVFCRHRTLFSAIRESFFKGSEGIFFFVLVYCIFSIEMEPAETLGVDPALVLRRWWRMNQRANGLVMWSYHLLSWCFTQLNAATELLSFNIV